MLPELPFYSSLLFVLTTFFTLWLFVITVKKSSVENIRRKVPVLIAGLILWLLLQAVLTVNNVYSADKNNFPPKIVLFGILPAFILPLLLFVTAAGRKFMASLPIKNLVLIHIVRLPVEVVLYFLFLHKTVPELMTFTGRNYDILAGLSAPFIIYYGFIKKRISTTLVLVWNFICLGLLINIVVSGLLSAPTPIQQFAFSQPNIAILYFPFSWLPTFIVPIVLLSHLITIYQLTKRSIFEN